ncbi:acyl carrier protein [Planomonospora sp. ID67723]|uniref:acyl carrier protein n=1 Tax=Planomonospora sp. ID67723 TaxID=2738134 RepID=UPI0018C44598|nr:acyl carrier protein [Planomonospora sp. ID67723]MBG0828425.1 acyl carrier protein [Planomonospora sp. ID67723]
MTSLDSATSVVRLAIAEVLSVPSDQVKPSATIADHQIDSLEWVEIAVIIEEKLGIQLEPADFAGARTVADMAGILHTALAAR